MPEAAFLEGSERAISRAGGWRSGAPEGLDTLLSTLAEAIKRGCFHPEIHSLGSESGRATFVPFDLESHLQKCDRLTETLTSAARGINKLNCL